MQKTLEVLPPVRRESSPSSILEAQVPLKVILANLAIDFAFFKLLLVEVLLDETCFQLLVDVYQTLCVSRFVFDERRSTLSVRYRSTVHHLSPVERNSLPA